jgi:hypothetical protein
LDISNSIISNTESDNLISDSYSGSISINAPFLDTNSILDFGRVPLSISTDKNISLANSGNSDLIINEIVFDSPLLSSSLETPLTLANGQSSEMAVTLTPESLGQFSSSILINHNGAESQNTIQVTAEVFSPNYLYIEDQSVNRDSNHIIKLGISNNDGIRAIQFDINIPNEFVFDYQNFQELDALSDFTISNSDLGNGNYRFVIYNLGDTVIQSGSNLLLDLPIYVSDNASIGDYNFEISNITLSNSSNSDVASEALEIGVVRVTDDVLDILTQQLSKINGYPNPFHSYYIINNPIPIEVEIYDVNGRVFINKYLEIGENIINTSHLSSGFYLIKLTHNNRKKVDILIKK